jgi:hypothetical protein
MKRFEHRVDEQVRRSHVVLFADSAGDEGWELVAVVSRTEERDAFDLFYRREKSSPEPTSEQVRAVVGKAHVNPQIARDALIAANCNVGLTVSNLSQVAHC